MGVSAVVLLLVTVFCFTLLCVLKTNRFKPERVRINANNLVLSTEEGVLMVEKNVLAKQVSLPCFSDPVEFPRENITFMDQDTVLGESCCFSNVQSRVIKQ